MKAHAIYLNDWIKAVSLGSAGDAKASMEMLAAAHKDVWTKTNGRESQQTAIQYEEIHRWKIKPVPIV